MALHPRNVLITGASRGIGLELVKQVVKLPKPPKYLLATCRNPETAGDLNNIAMQHSNVKVLKLDVTEADTFESVAKLIENYTEGDGLNLVINNAGINTRQGLENVTTDAMMHSYMANVVGPLQLTQALLPQLRLAAKASPDLPLGCNRAAVVNMSTILASMELNTSGGLYPYRASKAALNMVTKSMNVELKAEGILCFCMHPGWVQTDMGGPQASVTKETSVAGLLELMSKMKEDSDVFVEYSGKTLPW